MYINYWHICSPARMSVYPATSSILFSVFATWIVLINHHHPITGSTLTLLSICYQIWDRTSFSSLESHSFCSLKCLNSLQAISCRGTIGMTGTNAGCSMVGLVFEKPQLKLLGIVEITEYRPSDSLDISSWWTSFRSRGGIIPHIPQKSAIFTWSGSCPCLFILWYRWNAKSSLLYIGYTTALFLVFTAHKPVTVNWTILLSTEIRLPFLHRRLTGFSCPFINWTDIFVSLLHKRGTSCDKIWFYRW